ncbi:MAG: hypothetical protein QNJ46_03430 [Leptolyngbyaceae cyanobacterium MO_188.B28]|nr:hypothetical protein [Leptolyngbyaceae cyanobacterium MO_188.B28]
MPLPSLWLTGPTRSGKTTRLVQQLLLWAETLSQNSKKKSAPPQTGPSLLVFAANGDNRIVLADQIAAATQGRYSVHSTTPAGFIQDEVMLFWPLLIEQLGLKAQFALKLRPENEQELATRFWRQEIDQEILQVEGWREYELVRRSLDFLQLAASAGIPTEDIPVMLAQGMMLGQEADDPWQAIGAALVRWRDGCLNRGLLTYGIMTELYWRHLLPNETYQARLLNRYCRVLADDVDEYPEIARHWFEFFLENDVPCAFTFNPKGKVRLGVGADPDDLEELKRHCTLETLFVDPESTSVPISLGTLWADDVVEWVSNPLALPDLPETIQSIQETTRGQLLRRTAETIAEAIHTRQVSPNEVAVIGPGLDAIARYTFTEILAKKGIAVESLNDQRPLVSSPLIRALLTLLTLVYPGLGRLVDRDAVAEMLVVLSQTPSLDVGEPWFDQARIDPVRAELIGDHCFAPAVEEPKLLPVTSFPRWDRLGYRATQAYGEILQWLDDQKQQQQQRLIPNAITLLDRAIQRFLWRGNYLPYDQLAVLRELIETAQHYWEVEARLQQCGGVEGEGAIAPNTPNSDVVRFIQLLRRGTVTANPYPVKSLDPKRQGVTLATVFQYRSQRLCDRWQFWLDASSPRWLTGTDALFGAPIFLKNWSGRPLTAVEVEIGHEERLERILRDLLGRTTERVYLCHSDLATNGQEQTGPLLTLVNAAQEVEARREDLVDGKPSHPGRTG